MIYFLSYPFLFASLRLILRVLGRLRSSGEGNVPRRGGVLYCPNHISDADPAAIFVTAPRRCWMVGKKELFQIPVLGPYFAQLQGMDSLAEPRKPLLFGDVPKWQWFNAKSPNLTLPLIDERFERGCDHHKKAVQAILESGCRDE